MKGWRWGLGFLVALAAACRPEVVTPVDTGFEVAPRVVEFGRVLEGTRATQVVTIAAATRAAVRVTAATSAPFSTAGSIEVAAGSQVDLPIVFASGGAAAAGTLVLSTERGSLSVELHGTGVRPLTCVPSAACRTSQYSLELDRCVEAVLPDDEVCDPGSACVVNGRCRAGACLGVTRDCDDRNVCTLDACSAVTGCVHTPFACPTPAAACRRATCDPLFGCGETNAPEGDLCGPVSCSEVSVCVFGFCATLVPPDGSPCGEAVACVPAGTCQNKVCVHPDAGPWAPTWTLNLEGQPASEPALQVSAEGIFLPVCGLPSDAGPAADAGEGIDAGQPPDAGERPDAGEQADAGDAGEEHDAGSTDDGGRCALLSWTTTGYERFAAPLGEATQLVHLSGRGALLAGEAGIEFRSLATGERLETVPATAPSDGIAFAPDGAVFLVSEGGQCLAWTDAGLLGWNAALGAGATAFDSAGGLFVWSGDGHLRHLGARPDGGAQRSWQLDAGLRSLTVVGTSAVLGLATVVTLTNDGGLVMTPFDQGAGDPWLEPGGVLQTPREVTFATRHCPAPLTACADAQRRLWVSVSDVDTGARDWAVELGASRLVEAALFDAYRLDGGPGLGVGAVVTTPSAGGVALELLVGGDRVLSCPLPARTVGARAAAFQGRQLVVLAERADGGLALEAYELGRLPHHQGDWSARNGFQGWRRAQ